MNIGFDLWGTLIKGSPSFQLAKQLLLKEYFPQIPVGKFILAQERVKRELDRLTEQSGYQSTSGVRIRLLLKYIGLDFNNNDIHAKMELFFKDYQEIFKIFKPLLWSKETEDYYNQICDIVSNVYIVSNTLFIKQDALEYFIEDYFSYNGFYTSDSQNFAKPYRMIFNSSLDYFIGDNPKTDGVYAKSVGAKFIQINSNNKTIKDAYEIILNATNK